MKKKRAYLNNHKIMCIHGFKILVCYRWEAQSLTAAFRTLMNGFNTVTETVNAVRSGADNINSQSFKLLIIDILALIVSIKEGLLTPMRVISLLMNIYTVHKRYMALFHGEKHIVDGRIFMPQTTSITDLIAGFAMLGLPDRLIQAIKTFTSLTGKRIFDSEIAIEILAGFFESIIVIIEWIAEPIEGFPILPFAIKEALVGVFQWFGKGVFTHRRIKSICTLYSQYCTNPQIMFNPEFRGKAVKEYNSSKGDPVFMDYVLNSGNKYFTTTWTLFESNVVKSVAAFEESRREEPICIVFEGAAGSGKSAAMNQFVDLLRYKGYTTYCHTIPASEDGKDFYDDYENQDVFVMDDIGIQGKSQWRYIINFISPVKYPLPCATASKKNTKFFNSKIVLCTTNHFMDLNGFTSADCITEPAALFRRCHVIKVEKDATCATFEQILTYYKFSHLDPMPAWENSFLYHNHSHRDVPVKLSTREEEGTMNSMQKVQHFLYKILKNIEITNKMDMMNMAMDDQSLKNVIDAVDEYYAQSMFSFLMETSNAIHGAGCDYASIVKDWTEFIFKPLLDFFAKGIKMVSTSLSSLCSFSMPSMSLSDMLSRAIGLTKRAAGLMWDFTRDKYTELLSGVVLVLVSWSMWKLFDVDQKNDFSLDQKLDDKIDTILGENWQPQSDAPEKILNVKKFVKLIVVKKDSLSRDLDEVSHGVVSGAHILLPAHLDVKNVLIDVYHSYEHYRNGHKELENEQLRLIKMYPASDLAVYQFKNVIPLYKKCKNLFAYNVGAKCSNPLMYLINSTGIAPVLYGSSVVRNNEQVAYSKFANRYEHPPDSGFITNFSQSGACGTVLVSADDGIIGFHVAGGVKHGFCVQPSQLVKEDIRSIMLDGFEPDFEIDERVVPGVSGVRLRYSQPMEYSHISDKSQFIKTIFHRDNNDEIASLEKSLVDDQFGHSVPCTEIDHKAPPEFAGEGEKAKQRLQRISLKAFKHQGVITSDERAFIKKCLVSMMCKFDDLSDYETAFGGEFVKPLNKDSSNGYHCVKGKDAYFDFSSKEIKEEARKLFQEVKQQASNKQYDYNYFLSRETFKDELRKSSKKDTPRTFRVMPLGHIWWAKKIFGKLLKHFSDNRHRTGVCVGFNPYVDVDELVRKLKQQSCTGDADFGKWDGSVLALLMELIFEVFSEHYTGPNRDVIDWLCVTTMKSFVLVADELWSTTHGVPSGTWLTLLINCLLNKSLTALTIYRHKPNATVDDFYSVVDYVMGDDKVIGASGEMVNVFNLQTIEEVARSLGMDCTNGDKTPITSKSQSLDKLTFLKRHFRQHPRLRGYVGCLSLDTIVNTVQWMDKTKDFEESVGGKCRAMQIESYLHSPVLFNRLTAIFKNSMPFEPFFDEQQVIGILASPDAYVQVCGMSGKDISWL